MIERFDPSERRDNLTHRVFRDEHRRRYVLAADAIRSRPPIRGPILDAACGAGYGFCHLSPLGRYVGLDGHLPSVRACRERYPMGMFWLRDLDSEGLGAFEPSAIVSLETAEHLADPRGFLRRCFEALAPRRGTLVFSAPTSLTRDFDRFHRRDWPAWRWREELRRAGFAIERETAMPFTVRFREFLGTVPVSWRDVAGVVAFELAHPRYLAARLWGWGVRGRFAWESTLFVATAGELG